MAEDTSVRVELRGNVIAKAATMHDGSDEEGADPNAAIFLALDPAPPVGSRLTIFGGEGPGRLFEVRRPTTRDEQRGCLGRWIEDSGTGLAVGSEHIAPQNISSSMALAAPVAVTDEPTGVVEMLSGRKKPEPKPTDD
jgi:hypothetical protein